MIVVSKNIYRLTGILFSVAILIAASGAGLETAKCMAQTSVPRGTQMKVRLETTIDSKEAQNGDRFTATVLSPNRFADSTVEGHVTRVQQSGRVKGRTSISMVFDKIRFPNGQTKTMRAEISRIYGEKSVKEVDEEGQV